MLITERLHINDVELSQVYVYEYLGLLIDDKLTMGAHVDKVCTNDCTEKVWYLEKNLKIYQTESKKGL